MRTDDVRENGAVTFDPAAGSRFCGRRTGPRLVIRTTVASRPTRAVSAPADRFSVRDRSRRPLVQTTEYRNNVENRQMGVRIGCGVSLRTRPFVHHRPRPNPGAGVDHGRGRRGRDGLETRTAPRSRRRPDTFVPTVWRAVGRLGDLRIDDSKHIFELVDMEEYSQNNIFGVDLRLSRRNRERVDGEPSDSRVESAGSSTGTAPYLWRTALANRSVNPPGTDASCDIRCETRSDER